MEKDDWDLKKEYEVLSKQFKLPAFVAISEDFDIEKLSDKETQYLAREVRRVINEKLSAYLHLFETLMNPSNPPMFVISSLKKLGQHQKESIKSVYKKLAILQLEAMKLDTIYSEKKEVEFIIRSFNEWQSLKKAIYGLIEEFDSTLEEKSQESRQGYFG